MPLSSVPPVFEPAACSSVRTEASVDLLCRLEVWQEGEDYERIGIDRPREQIAGVEIPSLILPVRPSSNMATLVEVAVRDHQQRRVGTSAAARLDARLREEHARR